MSIVTQWFDKETQPKHIGVYEVPNRIGTRTRFFSYFDGKQFYFNSSSVKRAMQHYKDNIQGFNVNRPWRGLAERAK